MQFVQFYFTKEIDPKGSELKYKDDNQTPADLVNKPASFNTFLMGPYLLDFEKNTGQLVNLKLNDYYAFPDKKNNITTLFKELSQEQVLYSDLLFISKENNQASKVEYGKITFLYNEKDQTLIVRKEAANVSVEDIYSVDPQRPYSLLKNIMIKSQDHEKAYLYTEFKNTRFSLIPGTEEGSRMFQGASFHTDNLKYKKIAFKQFATNSFSQEADKNAWFGISQRYFVSAIAPEYPGKFYTKFLANNQSCIAGHLSQELSLKAQEPLVLKQRIYSGPEQKEYLQSFAPALEFVVDYGFFWPICSLILTVLVYINGFINNWGLSIILGTIAIRLLLIFLTIKQSHNLKKMQAIQPKLEAIKKNYNGDQAGFTQEVLAIYKAENLNPLTSLLSTIMAPIIQIPIFIAFYSVLMETVALRQAPFFGWIVDLSVKDPYYIIPVLVAGTAYVQQLISPKPQDEAMAFFMKMMPILLGLFCIQLPSGLGCYWATNNIISIIHTWKMQSGTITRSA